MIYTDNIRIEVDDNISLSYLNLNYATKQYEIVEYNRQFFGQWLNWLDTCNSAIDSASWLIMMQAKEKKICSKTFHILFKDELVGQINIFGLREGGTNGEIGYWLDSRHNGKGIMTKACKAMLNYGFETLNLHRIVIKACEGNHKSKSIPKRLGFTYEGLENESILLNGVFHNMEVYSILQSKM